MTLLWTEDAVLDYLNNEYSLPPEEAVACSLIYHSKSMHSLLELKTNYEKRVPKNRMAEVIGAIKMLFELPEDAEPQWYFEGGIYMHDQYEFLFESK